MSVDNDGSNRASCIPPCLLVALLFSFGRRLFGFLGGLARLSLFFGQFLFFFLGELLFVQALGGRQWCVGCCFFALGSRLGGGRRFSNGNAVGNLRRNSSRPTGPTEHARIAEHALGYGTAHGGFGDCQFFTFFGHHRGPNHGHGDSGTCPHVRSVGDDGNGFVLPDCDLTRSQNLAALVGQIFQAQNFSNLVLGYILAAHGRYGGDGGGGGWPR
mmetsp:Transcript_29827/g.81913  ORF Transcript_29827/g.81913 Transcript_29827/m.81913 type:complete len:215 (+) Transcript_29827:132-776(+)